MKIPTAAFRLIPLKLAHYYQRVSYLLIPSPACYRHLQTTIKAPTVLVWLDINLLDDNTSLTSSASTGTVTITAMAFSSWLMVPRCVSRIVSLPLRVSAVSWQKDNLVDSANVAFYVFLALAINHSLDCRFTEHFSAAVLELSSLL